MRPRLLIVEDESSLRDGLKTNLSKQGYEVFTAIDGEEALHFLKDNTVNLILLDIRLPKISGFEVCQRLRVSGDQTPILMLTARDETDDKIFGLKTGADDYMTKPFDLNELLARVEAMLRRSNWKPSVDTKKFEFNGYWVNFKTYQAQTELGLITLNKKEKAVLEILSKNQDQVISRKDLLRDVWDLPDHPNERIVDNVIVSLRKYFEKDTQNPKHILNIRGVGYKFVI